MRGKKREVIKLNIFPPSWNEYDDQAEDVRITIFEFTCLKIQHDFVYLSNDVLCVYIWRINYVFTHENRRLSLG